MAHYAFIDAANTVTEVIVGIDENELIDGVSPEIFYGNLRNQKCVRTSYNSKIRKNYAGVGYIYDENRDAFIPPYFECHSEKYLDEATCQWICENEEHKQTL